MFQVFMTFSGGLRRVTEDFVAAGIQMRRRTTQRHRRHHGLISAALRAIVMTTPLTMNLQLHVPDLNHNFPKMEPTFQFLPMILRSCWRGLPRMRASTLGPWVKSLVSEAARPRIPSTKPQSMPEGWEGLPVSAKARAAPNSRKASTFGPACARVRAHRRLRSTWTRTSTTAFTR